MAKVSTDVSDISVVMKLSTDVSHKYLPKEALEQLKTRQIYNINLSKQGFQCIPSEIIEYTHVCNVRILNMADQSYPDDASLDEDHSPLKSIGNIRVFRGLQELYLGNNCLRELPEEISTLDQLLIVDLRLNQLTSFPEQLCVLSKLQVLKLSGNRIQQVTHHIKNMTGLKELRLSNNRIVELPSEIEYLGKLQILTLQRNWLRALPQSMYRLRSLKELKLADNSLLYPPQEMETKDTVTILQYLQDHIYSGQEPCEHEDFGPCDHPELAKNPGILFPSNMKRVVINSLCTPGELGYEDLANHKCPMNEAVFINANKLKINKLNLNLANVMGLEYLDLYGNSFSNIPLAELDELPRLKGLSLEHQRDVSSRQCNRNSVYTFVMAVPEAIHILSKLVELNLAQNKIYEIPQSIDGLKNLKVLDFTENRIKNLPSTLFRLVKLEYLGLSSNSLAQIPDEIQKLSELQVLRLSHNSLQCLPESICCLKKLISLTLRHNQLKYLPLHFDKILHQFKPNPSAGGPVGYNAALLGHVYHPEIRLDNNQGLKFPPIIRCQNIERLISYYNERQDDLYFNDRWKRAQAAQDIKEPANNFSVDKGDTDLSDKLLLSISEQVGDKWFALGIELGLKKSKLDQIKIDNRTVSEQAFCMLSSWKNNTVEGGSSRLKKALIKVGLSRVTQDVHQ